MSARESGSDTWPRFAPFPADNLDLASPPEEGDVDHRSDPPSWLPGAGAVSTGADPPDLDASDDEQHDGGPVYAAGPDDSDAPGFSDPPVGAGQGGHATHGSNGDASAEAPDFGDGSASGFNGAAAEPPGFGDDAPGFGGTPIEHAPFVDAPGYGGGAGGHASYPQTGDVFGGQGPSAYGAAAEPAQSYQGAQQGEYVGPVTGEFRGDYESGYASSPDAGFGVTSQDAGFGGAQDAGFGGASDSGYATTHDSGRHGGPAVGTMYGDQTYQLGRENGARPLDQPTPFPSAYPPVEPPRSRMTASLRTVRRPRFGSRKRDERAGRQAQLTVGRIEPWSVMKFSFVISLVAFIVLFVAVAVLYAALSGLGVFSALQHSVSNITSSQGSSGFNLMTYLSASRVLGYTGLLGAINVVLITALCTVGSVLYNITANLAGGVEITLKESE
jgi:hypothetical protein